MVWTQKIGQKPKRNITPGATAIFSELSAVFGVEQIVAFKSDGTIIYEFTQWGDSIRKAINLPIAEITKILELLSRALFGDIKRLEEGNFGEFILRNTERIITGMITEKFAIVIVCGEDTTLTEVIMRLQEVKYEIDTIL